MLPRMAETGTNQIVYQAIERTYRSAILAHLRDNFIKHFGREHGQRLRKVLIRIGGESRIGRPEERVRITKALGVVNVHPRDAYDQERPYWMQSFGRSATAQFFSPS